MNYSIHQNYKNDYTEIKYLNNTRKNRVLKVKNSPLESKKDFKPIKVSMDDMDKFEEKQITEKRTFAKNTCYNW